MAATSALAKIRPFRGLTPDEEIEIEVSELRAENRRLLAEVKYLRHEVARRDEWADAVSAVVSNPPFRAR